MDITDILGLKNSRGYDPRTYPEWTKTETKHNTVPKLTANIPSLKGFTIPNLALNPDTIPVIHPFLRPKRDAPNNGEPVISINQLKPKGVNLTTLLRNNGNLNSVKCVFNEKTLNIGVDPDFLSGIAKTMEQYTAPLNITQDMTITNVVVNQTPQTWEKVFHDAMGEFNFIDMKIFEHEQRGFKVLPLREDIFRAFHLTPLPRIKVVIIGQDPYHSITGDVPTAHGLSFSVRNGNSIPPSLNNIFKEIARSIPNFQYPTHGDLSRWAEQGVLMLNSCLTVNPHEAKSHGAIWGGFIKHVMIAIEQANSRCIFVLWGRKAQKIKNMISSKSIILESSHPSPFSVNRGFNGCNHFVEINKHLLEMESEPINWNL